MRSWFVAIMLLCGAASAQANDWLSIQRVEENPGELDGFYYPREGSKALVVLLHGCTQDARRFAQDSGMLSAVQQAGMSLLTPQQRPSNNVSSCFSWFNKIDQTDGEARSIVAMVDQLKQQYGYTHIFMAGLSAGGAMAANIAAAFPKYFDAVAVVAGVSVACAETLAGAIGCMKAGADAATLTLPARPLPDMVVVTGSADKVVNPINGERLSQQWLAQFTHKTAPHIQQDQGMTYQTWQIKRHQLTLLTLDNFPHAWPVADSAMNVSGDPYVVVGPLNLSDWLVRQWSTYY